MNEELLGKIRTAYENESNELGSLLKQGGFSESELNQLRTAYENEDDSTFGSIVKSKLSQDPKKSFYDVGQPKKRGFYDLDKDMVDAKLQEDEEFNKQFYENPPEMPNPLVGVAKTGSDVLTSPGNLIASGLESGISNIDFLRPEGYEPISMGESYQNKPELQEKRLDIPWVPDQLPQNILRSEELSLANCEFYGHPLLSHRKNQSCRYVDASTGNSQDCPINYNMEMAPIKDNKCHQAM